MQLIELKRRVELALNRDHAHAEVVVTLDEPSVGGRMGIPISSAGMGIDWEACEFRLETATPIVRKGRAMDDPLRMYCHKYEYDTRTQTIYHCPICGEQLKKNMKYCFSCGQKVYSDSTIDRVQSLKTRK